MREEDLVNHIIMRLSPQVMDYVEVRNPTTKAQLVQLVEKERDEGVVETDGLDGERSRAEQVEIEGSKGLAREKRTRGKQCRGKKKVSEGSTESCNDHEGRHQSKRRLPERMNRRKCPETRNMTRREAAVERKVLSRRSSPGPPTGATVNHREVLPGRSSTYQLRSRRHIKERQEQSRRSSPYPLRNRLRISERQVATGRTSPYLTRAGGVKTTRIRTRFRPYK
ncbi:hypothetical protein NPIL_596561 [Nephila pilipes]|uniref:Uncharacterized protein n=1 Tax=Nephila pilipes TaxID=299642 RepID=A0A8X6QWM1_NEPPI|nr:hypothetical protein NPIL_596561 [Nephila pilipes]